MFEEDPGETAGSHAEVKCVEGGLGGEGDGCNGSVVCCCGCMVGLHCENLCRRMHFLPDFFEHLVEAFSLFQGGIVGGSLKIAEMLVARGASPALGIVLVNCVRVTMRRPYRTLSLR